MLWDKRLGEVMMGSIIFVLELGDWSEICIFMRGARLISDDDLLDIICE